jgi:hypothetical protein
MRTVLSTNLHDKQYVSLSLLQNSDSGVARTTAKKMTPDAPQHRTPTPTHEHNPAKK